MDSVNGEILVQSESGKGSRFLLRFAAWDPPSPDVSPAAVPALSRPISYTPDSRLREETYLDGRDTLLLIEDNADMLKYLQDALAESYNVFYARSGREATVKLDRMPPPRLILSDIMMDDMDGNEFLEWLIASGKFGSIPLIFLTAKTAEEADIASLSHGAVDVMHKPFSIQELKSKIHSVIRNQKAQRESSLHDFTVRLKDFMHSDSHGKTVAAAREEKFLRFRLTEHEKRIVLLLIQGLEYKEISNVLSISINTLKPYISNIYKKCGIQNKIELVNLFGLNSPHTDA
jgi:DNA-binding response OmpR family regulator